MITVNRPFYSLEPLEVYLSTLEEVTANPSVSSIADLKQADTELTSRTVLFPNRQFVHDEGYRTFGFDPCTASDGIVSIAKLALHEPGTKDYYDEYSRVFVGGDPKKDLTSEVSRQNASRGALIIVGGKLAVSGAFTLREMKPAYEAIVETMDKIGQQNEDFTKFGKRRIAVDLLRELKYSHRSTQPTLPIGNREAHKNVDAAWGVVGKPYGVLSRIFSHI